MASVSAALPRETSYSYTRTGFWLIGLCFIFSGGTGLVYEIVWARMLALVFGATTFAISTVLAAFMGGLALGSALAGVYARRIKRPLRGYAYLEFGIAGYALLVPVIFNAIDHVYALIWQYSEPGFFAFSLWRFLLSSAALLIPTTLMGATLPVLSAAVVRAVDHTSTSVAKLYTFNLIGAIAGTLAAGFVALPQLGVTNTIYLAAGVNFVVGVAAFLIDRAFVKSGVEVEDDSVKEIATTRAAPVPHVFEQKSLGSATRFWLFCAAVSGFVTFSLQVAWTRVLTMIIGSSTYAFSLVVALFILGLSIGAFLVSRRPTISNPRRMMVNVQLAIAATLFLSIWIINKSPILLHTLATKLQIASWLGLLSLQSLIAMLLVLVPSIFMGMAMPLVLVWASYRDEKAVSLVGKSYAVNTVGAILGAFAAGFILIPNLSTRFTILLGASLCVIVAAIAYEPFAKRVEADIQRALAGGVAFVLIIGLFAVAPRMNLADLSQGVYDSLVRQLAGSSYQLPDEKRTSAPGDHRLLMYKEGPTATVTVREDWGIRSLAINGRTNASDREDMPTQVIVGQLPFLVAPHTRQAMVVGFASGVTAGSMLQSPAESVVCVEMEPATIRASSFFDHVNNRPLEDPRFRLVVDDARAFLRVNPAQYDIIVSEPSHPWVPGVANLFTREFFQLGRQRLRDDGVFVQWVQIYQLSTESLRTVLATFNSVFPYVHMFRVGGVDTGKDLILVGSLQPIDLERMRERFGDERMRAELSRIDIRRPEDLQAWYVCDESVLAPAVQGAAINTDDNMVVEYRAPRDAFKPLMQSNSEWIQKLAAQHSIYRPR